MINTLLNLIKQAVVTWTDDSQAYPRGQASYNGKVSSYMRLSPYGLCSRPPAGSWVALFNLQGQESAKIGIADDVINRLKNLAEGECALYNTQTQSYAILKANGDIEADAKGSIKSTATGDISAEADGDITADAGGAITATAVSTATVTAPSIVLNGNVTIAGTLTQTGGGASSYSGLVSMPEASINGTDMKDHKHQEYDVGGLTGGPQ